jgi:O-antigen biosynthesis protein
MRNLRRRDKNLESPPHELLRHIFSSPLVNDVLCHERLGHGKDDVDAAAGYLGLPVALRPEISDFFDREYYNEKYPEVTSVGLDPFLHFMGSGYAQGQSPHPLIDVEYIRSVDIHVLPDGFSLSDLYDVLLYGLVDPSPYFSVEYYQHLIPEVTQGFLAHFLRDGIERGLRPNPLFDPLWYYRQLDDHHDVRSGLRHFVLQGDSEGRAPSPEFSARRYFDRNPDVAEAGVPALAHYLTNGRAEGRPYYPERVEPIPLATLTEPNADAEPYGPDPMALLQVVYDRAKAHIGEVRQELKDRVSPRPLAIANLPKLGRSAANLAVPLARHPKVTILVPIYNELRYTLECISSIVRAPPRTKYVLLIADDGSTDGSLARLKKIKNLKLIVQPSNVGFLANCNAAFKVCNTEYVLLLNNDAQLMPGALDSLVDLLDANPDVAAVGPKILYPDGRLQEAGCTLDRNAVATMTGLFGDPHSPEYNYDRDVHYCSGAALLIRRSDIGDTLFDGQFKPAYCEDADLCLRLLSRKRRVMYCAKAQVVHHLSASSPREVEAKRLQLIVRNQHKLANKWDALLADLNRSRIIAFYLPQYHPTPENDFHWGMGFTEWVNVAKAVPAYVDHYQPHIPADLGFYDLRMQQTIERQASLARRYGIDGFCVYYYNFGPRRALEQAFESIVANRELDFPYCVCWANENWTRQWDGGNQAVIFEQQYDHATQLAVVRDAVRYAADPRYLRVNGKPLLLVYRPLLIPDPNSFSSLCRRTFREAGFNDVHLVYVESMETSASASQPANLGFDACVEFPPHGRGVEVDAPREVLRSDFTGLQYDYEAAIWADMRRSTVSYKRYPAVFPSWDNTPRHPLRGDSFIGATPEIFQAYVEEKLDYMRKQFIGDERLLFVNAWNEWAEGTHLEPDQKFGHRWLEAIRNALMASTLI